MSQVKINTQTTEASSKEIEIAHEQAYLTMLYGRLDAQRATMSRRLSDVWGGPTVDNLQGYSEREQFAELYQGRSSELNAAERHLCFGRLDFDDEEPMYVGRLGLRNEDHDQVLVDWRAPASQSFYRATPTQRYGVTRRRHLHTTGRKVVDIDDDVLDLDAVDETHLTGEAALLASLRRGRTGRMGDIVATIQADQDRVIRDDLKGILVVEGGPGTGKTVVALHRAAYLLYTYRDQLAKRGILIIGPNGTFMRYIDQVLPSLGESDVVLATIGSLFPGVDAQAAEPAETARVKGEAKMPEVLAKAVSELQQVPRRTVEIKIDGTTYRLTPGACGKARAKARRRRDQFTRGPLKHNTARRFFMKAMLDELTRQAVQQLGGARVHLRPDDEKELRDEIAAEPAIRQALDVLWPEYTPQQLLALLYRDPERLDLSDDERAAITRARTTEWTPADVPLLDELAELLGPLDAIEQEEIRRRAAQRAEQAEAAQYARQIVDKLAEDAAIVIDPMDKDVFATWVSGGYQRPSGPSGTLAERALQDREWTYGHVIVDEAQELSAMAWRMLRRRCPGLSMTVVGDLAQTGSASGASSWGQVLDPVAAGRWRTERLTVNYRTPKPAMARAAAVLAVIDAEAVPPTAVRDSEEIPWTVEASDAELLGVLQTRVDEELARMGEGRLAVIAPPEQVTRIHFGVTAGQGDVLDSQVAVLTPEQTKGLEFDVVVVLDPAGIEAESERGLSDLYVALTRTTRRLGVVITETPSQQVKDALMS